MKGRRAFRVGVVLASLVLWAPAALAQKQPLAYVLPAGDKVVIVLGDVPPLLAGFTVARKGPGDKDFVSVTDQPVRPLDDPALARDMMGGDFDWISRRVETVDPDAVWRRIRARHDLASVLSLVSNGLRMALGRTFFDLDVKPGLSYSYRVVLLDAQGKELGRVEKPVTITPARAPAPPGKVRTALGKRDVTVQWDYPRYQGGDADLAVGFNVARAEQGGTPIVLTPSPALRIDGQLQFVDREPVEGVVYTYSVQAVDIIGTASTAAAAPPVTLIDTTPPMAPQGVTAVDQKDGVLLVWKISPEASADHYLVYRSAKEDAGYQQINDSPVAVGQPRFFDGKPVRGTAWYYKVTAISRSGIASAMSAAAAIIPQKTTPPAQVQGLQFVVDPKKRTVSFTWSAVDEPDLKGYIVFRGPSRTDMLRLTPKPLPPSSNPAWADAGWQGSGLPGGQTLVYAVAAVDTSLNEGKPSFVEVPIPDTVPPSAAFALSARSTRVGTAALSWQPSLSRNMALHRVQRKSGGAYAVVAELPVETTQWEDSSIVKGTAYTYRIIEVSAAGLESPPSPEATLVVTSSTAPSPPAGLAAAIGPRGVSLTWKAPSTGDAAGYRVYRASYQGAQFSLLTPVPVKDTSWLDTKGQKDAVYAVSTVDASGNESARISVGVASPAGTP
jgi:fibronectin type 3 domain-containing protein